MVISTQRKSRLSWVIRTALAGKSKLATGSFKGDCGNVQNSSWDVEQKDHEQEKAVAKEERGGTSTGKTERVENKKETITHKQAAGQYACPAKPCA